MIYVFIVGAFFVTAERLYKDIRDKRKLKTILFDIVLFLTTSVIMYYATPVYFELALKNDLLRDLLNY